MIALVDGEHYPPVVREALAELERRGEEVLAAVFLGGTEKIGDGPPDLGVTLVTAEDGERALVAALERFPVERVYDLSDEPVVGNRERFRLASLALARGVAYMGPGFHVEPPSRPRLARAPSIAVIGTGKRVGKTAVSAHACRLLAREARPVVVAMGRGGPAVPELLRGDQLELTPESLLAFAGEGKHAASDYFEDALMSRIMTVGCRRCGGGLSGDPFVSNVREGVELANSSGADFIVLEGSGSALPPVAADATLVVAGLSQGPEAIAGYLGMMRTLMADQLVITGCEGEGSDAVRLQEMSAAAGEINPEIEVTAVTFHPRPLEPVDGERVFVATTAPASIHARLARQLAAEHGCEVVGVSGSLSDRSLLRDEVRTALASSPFDTLLVELKAAAVDVATELALAAGKRVVYLDNVPQAIAGDLDAGLGRLFALARGRFASTERGVGHGA